MSATAAIVVLLVVITIELTVYLVYRWFAGLYAARNSFTERIAALERRELERDAILQQALKRGRKHHAYNTLNGIDTSIFNLVQAQSDADALMARLQTILGTLQVVRQGPDAYQTDKPAAKRPDGIED